MVCFGDIPTLEPLAAVDILRRDVSSLKVHLINAIDLMRLESEYLHGLSETEFDTSPRTAQ
jgi:xylulose-5-phosphate/fructose-6-phosphate phosphoketolase